MGKSARNKGQRGEREWRDIINKKFDVNYQRTPLSGGLDIKADLRKAYGSRDSRVDDFHWEVKRQEHLNIYKALQQAMGDCRDKVPVVAHRRNQGKWMITLLADDFLNYIQELDDLSKL